MMELTVAVDGTDSHKKGIGIHLKIKKRGNSSGIISWKVHVCTYLQFTFDREKS